jgi:hypothetical protein
MNNFCDYCKQPAKLITGLELYPHRDDLAGLSFWKCEPCAAWVGCHKAGARVHLGHASVTSDGTLPLGRLANAELRAAKSRAHAAFDRCWKSYAVWQRHPAFDDAAKYPAARRRLLYGWLAKQMKLPPHECHIGMFTEAQCDQVVSVVEQARSLAEA